MRPPGGEWLAATAGKAGPGSGDPVPTVRGVPLGYPRVANGSTVPTGSEMWEPRKPFPACGEGCVRDWRSAGELFFLPPEP